MYNSLQLSETETKNNDETLVQTFKEYYIPKQNQNFEVFNFHMRKQRP